MNPILEALYALIVERDLVATALESGDWQKYHAARIRSDAALKSLPTALAKIRFEAARTEEAVEWLEKIR